MLRLSAAALFLLSVLSTTHALPLPAHTNDISSRASSGLGSGTACPPGSHGGCIGNAGRSLESQEVEVEARESAPEVVEPREVELEVRQGSNTACPPSANSGCIGNSGRSLESQEQVEVVEPREVEVEIDARETTACPPTSGGCIGNSGRSLEAREPVEVEVRQSPAQEEEVEKRGAGFCPPGGLPCIGNDNGERDSQFCPPGGKRGTEGGEVGWCIGNK